MSAPYFSLTEELGSAIEVGIRLAAEVPGRHVYAVDCDVFIFF